MLVAMSSLMLSMTAHPFFNASDAAVASATSTVTIGSAPSYWSQMPSAAPPGGGDAYTISVGTALVFKYSVDHNVWLLPDGAAWSSCNFVGGTELASRTFGIDGVVGTYPDSNMWTAVATTPGLYYIACQVTSHCDGGQKIKVEVTPAPPTPPTPPPSPARAPSPPPAVKEDPCFPSTATVRLANGAVVPMAKLKASDEIVASDSSGVLQTDSVSALSIADPSAVKRRFVTLSTHANRTLVLTPGHHLPVGDECCTRLKQASEVVEGDTVWVVMNYTAPRATPAKVSKVGSSVQDGLHSPVLKGGGFPIVDQFVTSFDTITKVRLMRAFGPPLEPLATKMGAVGLVRRTLLGAQHTYIA